MKNERTPEAYEKSRLVVQGFNENHGILTRAPTVQRTFLRLHLALVICNPNISFFIRDVRQAYVLSKTIFNWPIFIKPPDILGFPSGFYFESTVHSTEFQKKASIGSLPAPSTTWRGKKCTRQPTTPACGTLKIVWRFQLVRQVHRGELPVFRPTTQLSGNKPFAQLEGKKRSVFHWKEAVILQDRQSVKFNGAMIVLKILVYSLTQPGHLKNLKQLALKSATREEFITERARGSYTSAVCRPESTFC